LSIVVEDEGSIGAGELSDVSHCLFVEINIYYYYQTKYLFNFKPIQTSYQHQNQYQQRP
jgi:hypothetical protein